MRAPYLRVCVRRIFAGCYYWPLTRGRTSAVVPRYLSPFYGCALVLIAGHFTLFPTPFFLRSPYSRRSKLLAACARRPAPSLLILFCPILPARPVSSQIRTTLHLRAAYIPGHVSFFLAMFRFRVVCHATVSHWARCQCRPLWSCTCHHGEFM